MNLFAHFHLVLTLKIPELHFHSPIHTRVVFTEALGHLTFLHLVRKVKHTYIHTYTHTHTQTQEVHFLKTQRYTLLPPRAQLRPVPCISCFLSLVTLSHHTVCRIQTILTHLQNEESFVEVTSWS